MGDKTLLSSSAAAAPCHVLGARPGPQGPEPPLSGALRPWANLPAGMVQSPAREEEADSPKTPNAIRNRETAEGTDLAPVATVP